MYSYRPKTEFPLDILRYIFKLLPVDKDLVNLMLVNKAWQAELYSNHFWRDKLSIYYPENPDLIFSSEAERERADFFRWSFRKKHIWFTPKFRPLISLVKERYQPETWLESIHYKELMTHVREYGYKPSLKTLLAIVSPKTLLYIAIKAKRKPALTHCFNLIKDEWDKQFVDEPDYPNWLLTLAILCRQQAFLAGSLSAPWFTDTDTTTFPRTGRFDRQDYCAHYSVLYGEDVELSYVMLAARCGNLEAVKLFLENGADPNQTEPATGFTLLHCAVKANSIESVRLLVQKGADVNQADKKGRTPLYHAICEEHFEMIKELIRLNAKKDCFRKVPIKVLSTLFARIRIETMLFIIERGILKLDTQPMDALLFDYEPEKQLILKSIGFDAKNINPKAGIYISCSTLLKLSEHPAVNPLLMCDGEGNTLVHYINESLLRHNNFNTYLKLLTNFKNLGFDFSTKNKEGETFFHVALYFMTCECLSPLSVLDSQIDLDKIKTSLEFVSNINETNDADVTYLHILAENSEHMFDPNARNFRTLWELFIEKGANLNAQNSDGDTPAHILLSAIPMKYSIRAVYFLKKNNADLTIENSKAETPIAVLKSREVEENFSLVGHIIQKWDDEILASNIARILAAKTKVNLFDERDLELELEYEEWWDFEDENDNEDTLAMRSLIKNCIDGPALFLTDGDTLLHMVLQFAGNEKPKTLKTLLDKQNIVEINAKNADGDTALHIAAECGYQNAVNLLLEAGAEVTEHNAEGRAPLHVAANLENYDLLVIFFKQGTEPNIVNAKQQTCLHEIARLARKHEALPFDYLLLWQACKNHQVNLDAQDGEGNTAAHIFLENVSLSQGETALKWVEQFGCDLEVKNNRQETPREILQRRAAGEREQRENQSAFFQSNLFRQQMPRPGEINNDVRTPRR